MTPRTPTLASFTLYAGEGPIPQPQNNFGAAVHSSRLAQALCWLLVLFL
jgi:hypothetical protein